ncbi:5-(carboxyamino)imidazole ribonucleotide synthase [Roseibacillus ishigakijimensis]|uniref:N5-carboxyaminoimidazole ribonucleotide synthase n=1 Tax=Roseibacillus ishigakijimensis TaxID=454146 RepID=A0A934RPN1_9BACT|nr:5-(carboxyamino)imidazole ribonucleotide synthase [Roseibacillus ishigakijimensis]MBK1832809.1 5-(carboxyamino)imidazole ribonucleotide synthase [Roseibacillus ishigakijimensis]
MILPGGTIGILGGGQLGRMLCLEARRMGYRTVVWSGSEVAEPTVGVADEVILKPFTDAEAQAEFLAKVQVATVEFENIDHDVLRAVDAAVGLHPRPEAVAVCQNRETEKMFLQGKGIPCAPFRVITNAAELEEGIIALGGQGVLKTAAFGYDGKGQLRVREGMDWEKVWAEFDYPRAVLEKWIPFECEISVMVARGQDGSMEVYDVAENVHRQHVLDHSIVPARVEPSLAEEAREWARKLAEGLQYVGIMGVEFFVSASDGLLVNEMAPRPHNSGHHTMDACVTSQFEQQLRAITGLRLGSSRLHTPVVMLNLLGDLWRGEDLFGSLGGGENVTWHLYGKSGTQGLRKCGHANFLGEDALAKALDLKASVLGE